MRKSRYTEEQIIGILKEAENGKVMEVIRRHGIAQKTYYNWKRKLPHSPDSLELDSPVADGRVHEEVAV